MLYDWRVPIKLDIQLFPSSPLFHELNRTFGKINRGVPHPCIGGRRNAWLLELCGPVGILWIPDFSVVQYNHGVAYFAFGIGSLSEFKLNRKTVYVHDK